MQRDILIAIDDSRHSKIAVDYASIIYQAAKDVKFTVKHVQPPISQYLLDEAKSNPRVHKELQKLIQRHDEHARKLLDKCQNHMLRVGIAEDSIKLMSKPRKQGIAKDLIRFATHGRFDALIMGRRGLSGLQEMLVGSVSANLVNNTVDTPVWLVEEQGHSQNILVAVDGSENSVKAVDHLAFVMEGNTDLKITLFHLAPQLKDLFPIEIKAKDADSEVLEEIILKGDKLRIDQFYAQAKRRLKKAGIQKNQINFLVEQGTSKTGRIGNAVLNKYRKGKFGTLVVGRRGVNKKYFSGSVSRYLVNQFHAGALWIVP